MSGFTLAIIAMAVVLLAAIGWMERETRAPICRRCRGTRLLERSWRYYDLKELRWIDEPATIPCPNCIGPDSRGA